MFPLYYLFLGLGDGEVNQDWQISMLREYLKEKKALGDFDGEITETDIERLSVHVTKCTLVSIKYMVSWNCLSHSVNCTKRETKLNFQSIPAESLEQKASSFGGIADLVGGDAIET